MKNSMKNIFDFIEGNLSDNKNREFEMELQRNKKFRKEYNFIAQIDEFLQAKFDFEEVLSDPGLPRANQLAFEILSEYHYNPFKYSKNELFIKNSIAEDDEAEQELRRKLKQIKSEIDRKGNSKTSENRVDEWIEKIQDTINEKTDNQDIRAFVVDALESTEPQIRIKSSNTGWVNTKVIRIVSFSAAAVLAAFLLVRTLSVLPDPDSIYKEYYKPISTFSPITRNLNQNISLNYANAIKMYKQGKHQSALTIFFDLSKSDPLSIAPRFYEGITQMELKNYPQAIEHLTWVAAQHREYFKEAQWYLGLAYLKTNELSKAISCFEVLAKSEGYYHNQACEILRRME